MLTLNPLISVIIVNYNGAGVLRQCLRSVYRQTYRPIEVIVVDNNSSDESVQIVEQEFTEARLVQSRRNLGFAEGNNRGVDESKGEYILLLNNDTEVEDNWIEGLLQMMQDNRVAVVTSRVITDGVPEKFYEQNGTINYLGYNIMRHFPDLSEIFFAGGASLMFRKSVVGLPFLDEFFLYHEDVYLSWRMKLKGYSVKMAQSSVVRHRGSVTTKQQKNELVTFYQERNRILNTLLFFETTTLMVLMPYMVVDAMAKLFLSLVGGRKSFTGIVRAYLWPVVNMRWVGAERARVQGERLVPDSEILRCMSFKVIDSDRSFARILNAASHRYARITGLAR